MAYSPSCRSNQVSAPGISVATGAKIAKEGNTPNWGCHFGYFSDPDGYLWKVASPQN